MRQLLFLILIICGTAVAQRPSDTVAATGGDIVITPIAHGTVHVQHGSTVIVVDPTIYGGWDGPHPGGVVPQIDYAGLKPPTLILVTDIHGDHYDTDAMAKLKTPATKIVAPNIPGWQYPAGLITLANGRSQAIDGVTIEAVAMYNLVRGPKPGALFHTKGRGNGYVVTLGGKLLYFSGDTE